MNSSNKVNSSVLLVETAGLCHRCCPATEKTVNICVVDCTVSMERIHMVSGTTGITGAADSSFVLKETKRGSSHATLYCTGRDIEYREIELAQDKENHCWNLESDSLENPDVLLDDVVRVFSDFIKAEKKFIDSPTELAQKIADSTGHSFTAAALSKKLLQNQYELEQMGIIYTSKSSNSKRTVTAIYRDGSVGSDGKNEISPYPKTAVLP